MENKQELLNKAKILLISDMKEDYKVLISFGFKNIDWIKSMVIADSYFMDNIEKLDDYFIIITGFQKTYNYRLLKNIKLEDYLKSLQTRKYFYEEPNSRMTFPWFLELYVKVPIEISNQNWNINNKSLNSILNDIVNYCTFGSTEKSDILPKKEKNKNSVIVNDNDVSILKVFENIRMLSAKYLNNRYKYYSKQKDVNIYEVNNKIRVEYMINGKILCAITFDKAFSEIKVIDMELLNEKGKLVKTDLILSSDDCKRYEAKKVSALKFLETKLMDYINSLQIKSREKYLKYSKIK